MGLEDVAPNDGSKHRTTEQIKIEFVDSDLGVWKATWPSKTDAYAVESTKLEAVHKLISIIENEKEESD